MNALNKFVKHNKNVELKKLKYGTTFKNYYDKNKYIFNEIYKEKLIPKNELVFLIKRILKHKSKFETSKPDLLLKKIAEGFVKDHHELFPDIIEGDEATDDEYEEDKPKIYSNKKEEIMTKNHVKNDDKNHVENTVLNDDKNHVENTVLNDDENMTKNHDQNDVKNSALETIEKIEEIKQDVKEIEQLKEHPDKKHIQEFNSKIEELKEDINRKFNDMIDAHMDLKKSIDEKRNISQHDAKSRIENMEGKIEMLYGKQMEESLNPKKKYVPKIKSKEDILREYLGHKFK